MVVRLKIGILYTLTYIGKCHGEAIFYSWYDTNQPLCSMSGKVCGGKHWRKKFTYIYFSSATMPNFVTCSSNLSYLYIVRAHGHPCTCTYFEGKHAEGCPRVVILKQRIDAKSN